MQFNSYTYVAFLVIVVALYRCLGRTAQNRLLLVMSYVFYGSWSVKFRARMRS